MRLPLVLFFVVFLFSCEEVGDSYHLSRSEMQNLLEDIHLAESYSIQVDKDSLPNNKERNYDSLAAYYSIILKHYNITLEQFEKNLQWYKSNPDQLDSVYAKMIEHVQQLDSLYKTNSN